jgi:hypothetical protein
MINPVQTNFVEKNFVLWIFSGESGLFGIQDTSDVSKREWLILKRLVSGSAYLYQRSVYG